MKKKWAVRPWELWNPGAVEGWLEAEAAKGWYLIRCNGWFSTFERGEPDKRCRVRIQPQGPESREEFDRRTDLYAEMGWRFYAVAGRNLDVDFEVYYCNDPAAPELDTDPVAYGWAWEKQLKKAWWTGLLCPLLMGAFLIGVLAAMQGRYGSALQLLLDLPAPLLFALLVLWPLLTATHARQLYLVHGLRRKIKAGLKPEHNGSWRAGRWWWRIMTWIMLSYWLVYLVSSVGMVRWAMDEKDLPYVTTSELLPDTRPEDWYFEDYRLKNTPLRPVYFRIRMGDEQQRRIINETEQLRFQVLAEARMEEKQQEYLTSWTEGDQTELTHPAFDEAVLLNNGENLSVLLARSGKTVCSLWVNFPADLAGRLDSLAEGLE